MTLVGLAILIYRRRTVGPVFSATTNMDKVMYAVPRGRDRARHVEHHRRFDPHHRRPLRLPRGVSVWYRWFAFQPHPELMADAPLGFQLHALVAFGLFALWPFTRLVHVFSAPLGYLTRPYIVYRSATTRSSAATGRAAAGTASATPLDRRSRRRAQRTGDRGPMTPRTSSARGEGEHNQTNSEVCRA